MVIANVKVARNVSLKSLTTRRSLSREVGADGDGAEVAPD